MTRVTDPDKLNRIKNCTMDLIVRSGYSGMTIATIASEAGVSAGYLYRHFAGKDDLIKALVIENFHVLSNTVDQLLEESNDITSIVGYYLDTLFDMAITTPIKARFVSALIKDPRYRMEAREKQVLNIPEIAARLLRKGHQTGEINAEVTVRETMLFLLSLPLDYIAQELDEDHGSDGFSPVARQRLARMCLKALR